MKILVTGITGFLGKEFLKHIIKDNKNEYILLIRESSISKIYGLIEEHEHIHAEVGSLKNTLLFSDARLFDKYTKTVEKVIHLAALYDLSASSDILYLTNVIGTQNVLYFCKQCPKLIFLDYASTIAVAGNWSGLYYESDFDIGQEFENPYAKTKFQAEALVRKLSKNSPELIVRVIRFGVIVGDSKTGAISKSDGPYYFFSNIGKLFQIAPILKKLKFVPFPFNADSLFPIVPVDTGAQLLATPARLESGLETIHCLAKGLPTMETFLNDFLLSIDVTLAIISIPKNKVISKILPRFSIPVALVEYLYMPTSFECRNIDHYLPDRVNYNTLKGPLFNFVVAKILKKDKS